MTPTIRAYFDELEKIAAFALVPYVGRAAKSAAGPATGQAVTRPLLGPTARWAAGGGAAGAGVTGNVRAALTQRAARRTKMVNDLALKQTTERLGGNSAQAEKFLAGKRGDKLRSAARESLTGKDEYNHLYPNHPGLSAYLAAGEKRLNTLRGQ
jgi:hypothetical protein